ncbi:MAG: hypothetical protein ACLFUZ_00430 [Candidatus Micrarchaeia archaeon]
MDFSAAADEVSRVEGSAEEYKRPEIKKKRVERSLELSPQEIYELEYPDIVNQYNRLKKIISASRMDMGMFGKEPVEPAEPVRPAGKAKGKAREVEKEMKKISIERAREAVRPAPVAEKKPPEKEAPPKPAEPEIGPMPGEPEGPAPRKAPPPKPKKEKAPPAPILPEKPAPKKPKKITPPSVEKPPQPTEATEPVPEAPEPEVVSPEEAPPAPAPEPGVIVEVPVPKELSESPVKEAEKTVDRLEKQLGAQMTGKRKKKVDVEDTKKRMMELTRELFKERSTSRRAEIKKEIVALKGLISKSREGEAVSGGLPEGSLLDALKDEQKYELRDAKKKVESIYEKNHKKLLAELKDQRAIAHRGPAFDEFSSKLVELEQKLMELIDKYHPFLVAKHTAELSKLKAKGASTPESEKLKKKISMEYGHEFSEFKNSIGEEIHSQLESTRAVLFEDAGDPEAAKLSQISNAPEDSLFNLLQAKEPRLYDKYSRGEKSRAEALREARRLMAIEAGIDEDTINKRFGSK